MTVIPALGEMGAEEQAAKVGPIGGITSGLLGCGEVCLQDTARVLIDTTERASSEVSLQRGVCIG